MKRDAELTLLAKFKSEYSYVAPDGREVLYGEDWKARVEELRQRSGGRCEEAIWVDVYDSHVQSMPYSGRAQVRCTQEAADPHHIIRRSVRRDDRLSNLQALCRYHHDLLDKRKPQFKAFVEQESKP